MGWSTSAKSICSTFMSVLGHRDKQVKKDSLHGFCLIDGYDLLRTWGEEWEEHGAGVWGGRGANE